MSASTVKVVATLSRSCATALPACSASPSTSISRKIIRPSHMQPHPLRLLDPCRLRTNHNSCGAFIQHLHINYSKSNLFCNHQAKLLNECIWHTKVAVPIHALLQAGPDNGNIDSAPLIRKENE